MELDKKELLFRIEQGIRWLDEEEKAVESKDILADYYQVYSDEHFGVVNYIVHLERDNEITLDDVKILFNIHMVFSKDDVNIVDIIGSENIDEEKRRILGDTVYNYLSEVIKKRSKRKSFIFLNFLKKTK